MEHNTVVGTNYGNVGGTNNIAVSINNDGLIAMQALKELAPLVPEEDRAEYIENVDFITEEIQKDQLKKKLLQRAWDGIKKVGNSQAFQKAIETAAPIVISKLMGGTP